ncbi:MAG: MlaC/ttg2D family ABC transporter substrate-binding protein [Dissulfurimicrobium sp.]|uniref:MlaC/ttg2D family ABC transporter substrate-binding protein n=1 Tax=Dissulfurimicrobium sp. TaxID=2022436 RepID=UPI00404B23FA
MKTIFSSGLPAILLLIFLMTLSLQPVMASNNNGQDPLALITVTVNSILDLLNNKNISKEQRINRIRSLVFEHFDFNEMSKRVLATNWRGLTPAQQKTFTDIFSKLLEATYIGKIELYSDVKVTFQNEIIQDDIAKVNTVIHTKTNDIPLVYYMFFNGKNWYVYDVIIENVSLISTYRSTYNQIIKQNGFDALIKEMNKKIEELNAPRNNNGKSA